jgi:general stress protein YciG
MYCGNASGEHVASKIRRSNVRRSGKFEEASMAMNESEQPGTKKTSHRGFAAMDEEKQREIAKKGGESQGKENNPGNFANDRQRAAEAGRKGGEARGRRKTQ